MLKGAGEFFAGLVTLERNDGPMAWPFNFAPNRQELEWQQVSIAKGQITLYSCSETEQGLDADGHDTALWGPDR